MRRVSGLRGSKGAEEGVETQDSTPKASAANVIRMQNAGEFYDLLGKRRFGDADKPVDVTELAKVLGDKRFREMTSRVRDNVVREAAGSPTAKVAPGQVYRAWAGLLVEDQMRQGAQPADASEAFNDSLAWGQAILEGLRKHNSMFVFRNTLQSSVDVLSKIGGYEPEVLLARELAKRGELGGSGILTSVLDRCYVPSDVSAALQAQLRAFAVVPSTIPAPPAAAVQPKLDDHAVIDAVLQNDANYARAVTALRAQVVRTRTLPGSALNLRDQVNDPVALRDSFDRLASCLGDAAIGPDARELLFMVANLVASNEVSHAVKKIALVGIDQTLRRLEKEARSAAARSANAPVPAFGSLAAVLTAARNRFNDDFNSNTARNLDPSQAKTLRDAVDGLIANVFKETDDAHFAVETMAGAADPAAILLRTMTSRKERSDLIDGVLARNASGAARGAHVALIVDKARREDEIRKLVAADKNFRPTAESAALLLSWPKGLPLPAGDAQASAVRAEELKSLGPNKLQALIEKCEPAQKIFEELMSIGADAKFVMGSDDSNIDENVAKIIRGEAEPKKGGFMGRDTLTPLLQSTAIAALPMQIKHGFTEAQVKESLVRAIRAQNGALLTTEHGLQMLLKTNKVKLETVFEALAFVDANRDPNDPDITMSAVNPGRNVPFAYRLLVECHIAMPTALPQILEAARNLLKRTGIVSLAPYAGLKPEDNLAILLPDGVKPDSPHFVWLLDMLSLPPTALTSIIQRPDLETFPADTLFEIFARAIQDKKVTADDLAKLAVAALTRSSSSSAQIGATNAWVTFNELAARAQDYPNIGKLILQGLASKQNIDQVYRAAATAGVDGKLFDANDVLDAVIARDATTTQSMLVELATRAPQFFQGLTDANKIKLLGRALKSLETTIDASILDDARPCFARLAELNKAGVKVPNEFAATLTTIVTNAVLRASKNPLEVAALGPILTDARASGVDVEKLANGLFADTKLTKNIAANHLAAIRFELARLVPTSNADLIIPSIPGGKMDVGPYMAAFELVASRDLPEDVAKQLCRSAIGWAADQKAFRAVVGFRKRIADTSSPQTLAAFDSALSDAMKDQPAVWSAVPEARSLAAGTKMEELRAEILELASCGPNGDADGLAKALADRIASVGPYAPELVPQVLDALRREVRALRPSLDDIQVGLDVPQSPSAGAQKAAQSVPTVDFFGVPLRVYGGERGHARIPDAMNFVPTPTSMSNMKRLIEAMQSEHPFIILLGPPGPGKTFGLKVLAHHMGAPMVELDGGPERRNDEFAGSWKSDKSGMPSFERGDQLNVFQKGGFLVDDEFQASKMFVLEQHAKLASRFNKEVVVRTDANETVRRSKDTKIVLVGNFLDRNIPAALREHAVIVYFDSLLLPDQLQIAQVKAPSLNAVDLEALGTMQMAVENLMTYNNLANTMALSVRNLTRAAKRAERYRNDPQVAAARAACESYVDGIVDPNTRALVVKEFTELFKLTPEQVRRNPADIEISQGPKSVSIGEATVEHGSATPVDAANLTLNNFGVDVPFILGDRERIELEQLAKAFEMKESTLFVAPRESGVIAIVEAMAQLTGLPLTVEEVTQETNTAEMFGEASMRPTGDGNFETYFANGFITDVTEKGGIVVLRHVHRMKDSTRIALHRMLEERKVPGPNGTMIDMHPNAHIIMTTEPNQQIGQALQNRVTQRSLQAKSQAEILERLVAVGENLGVPKVIVEQMVRFDEMWKKMIGRNVAEWMQRHNLPEAGMNKLLDWVCDFSRVVNGTSNRPGSLDEQIKACFIQGGLTHYCVPNGRKFDANKQAMMSDNQRLEAILTALFESKDAEAEKLVG